MEEFKSLLCAMKEVLSSTNLLKNPLFNKEGNQQLRERPKLGALIYHFPSTSDDIDNKNYYILIGSHLCQVKLVSGIGQSEMTPLTAFHDFT